MWRTAMEEDAYAMRTLRILLVAGRPRGAHHKANRMEPALSAVRSHDAGPVAREKEGVVANGGGNLQPGANHVSNNLFRYQNLS